MIPDLVRRALLRAGRVARFLAYFAGRLLLANLIVAWEIITPGIGLSPGIVHVPLRSRTRAEVVLIALVVGLIPGTLTVAVRRRPPGLYVHGMYAADLAAFRREVADMEERLLLAVRPVGASSAGPARPARPVRR